MMATILGTPGNDPNLNGINAADLINGLASADTMRGFIGNDTAIVDNAGERPVESVDNAPREIDLVQLSVSHTLDLEIENLTPISTAPLTSAICP
jgi:Ca2+-binding RTX toxin-like protein